MPPRRLVSRADTRRGIQGSVSVRREHRIFDESTRLGLRADQAAAAGRHSKATRLRVEARRVTDGHRRG
jgi:hypothetical protein